MQKIDTKDIEGVVNLINAGNSVRDTAFMLGKHESTLWRWLKILRKQGYKIKTVQGRRPKR